MLEVVRVDLTVGEGEVRHDVVVEDLDLELIAQGLELTLDGLEDLGMRGAGSADDYLLKLAGGSLCGISGGGVTGGSFALGGVGGVGGGGAAGGEAEHKRGTQQDGKQLFHFSFSPSKYFYLMRRSLSLEPSVPALWKNCTTTTMTAHMVSMTAVLYRE